MSARTSAVSGPCRQPWCLPVLTGCSAARTTSAELRRIKQASSGRRPHRYRLVARPRRKSVPAFPRQIDVDVLPAIGKLCEWRDYGKPFIVACLNVPMDAYLSCPLVIIIRQKRFRFRLAQCQERIYADGHRHRTRREQTQETLNLFQCISAVLAAGWCDHNRGRRARGIIRA